MIGLLMRMSKDLDECHEVPSSNGRTDGREPGESRAASLPNRPLGRDRTRRRARYEQGERKTHKGAIRIAGRPQRAHSGDVVQ